VPEARIGVIGGSGLYRMAGLTDVEEVRLSTPFGDPSDALSAPLPVVRVDDLEAAFDAVSKAGGVIAKPIFSFPGGRRFHFIDPSGSELAVWSER